MRPVYLATLLRISALAAVVVAALLWLRPGPTPSAPATAQETVTIAVGDTWFCDSSFQGGVCETTIDTGDTVVWNFGSASLPHTTTECGDSCDSPTDTPLWNSGLITDGSTFQFTFSQPDTYLYYCEVHPFLMRGRIVVQGAGQEPTPTATASPPPMPTEPPAPTPTGPLGDVNCNGAVNSIDAALILQFNAGLIDSLSCQENADVNGDGAINSIDAALILQFDAGLIGTLTP